MANTKYHVHITSTYIYIITTDVFSSFPYNMRPALPFPFLLSQFTITYRFPSRIKAINVSTHSFLHALSGTIRITRKIVRVWSILFGQSTCIIYMYIYLFQIYTLAFVFINTCARTASGRKLDDNRSAV